MEIKAGDYVRTKNGEIRRIVKATDDCYVLDKDIVVAHIDGIAKTSPDIIDLIEVGDYVNGYKVIDIAFASSKAIYVEKKCEGAILPVSSIETIITKEQFESMEYKIND